MRGLRGGPTRQSTIDNLRNGARWADRAVRMDGKVVSRLKRLGRPLHRKAYVTDGRCNFVLCNFRRTHALEKLGLVGQPRPFRPLRLERARSLDRAPFGARDDAEEVILPDHLEKTRYFLGWTRIDALQRCSHSGRAHDAPVEHSLYSEILDVGETAGAFIRNIETRTRRTNDLEL